MDKFKFFWDTMELCDWDHEGDDDLVLAPVIKYLSEQENEKIFLFDDLMSELLYGLDTRKLSDECARLTGFLSDDGFLYSRCVALINGPKYYEEAKKGKRKEMWQMEFEALLYVPQQAWEVNHAEEYPHIPPLSFETGSNTEGWK